MAESAASLWLDSLVIPSEESEDHDGLNVDDVIGATVDEAANQEDVEQGSQEHVTSRCLDDLPAHLYDASRVLLLGEERS